MTPYEQALGKAKLPFNWKKHLPEPGSGRGSHLLQELRVTRQKTPCGREHLCVIFIVNGSQQTASSLGVAFAVCLFTLWSSVRSVLITDLATPLIGIFCFFSLDLILRVTVKSYQIQFEHLESTPDFFLICFNLSWNNKGTDHTWPKNCLWINCPITFEPLKIARIPKHLIR